MHSCPPRRTTHVPRGRAAAADFPPLPLHPILHGCDRAIFSMAAKWVATAAWLQQRPIPYYIPPLFRVADGLFSGSGGLWATWIDLFHPSARGQTALPLLLAGRRFCYQISTPGAVSHMATRRGSRRLNV